MDSAESLEHAVFGADVDDGWEWAIVEIMGHRRHVGRCREVERFGAKLIRVDVPVINPKAEAARIVEWQTFHYSGAALFSYTRTDEASAMKANRPVAESAVYRLGYDRRSPVDDLHDQAEDIDPFEEERHHGNRVVQALREYFPDRFREGEEITPERIAQLAGDLKTFAAASGIEPQAEYDAGPGTG